MVGSAGRNGLFNVSWVAVSSSINKPHSQKIAAQTAAILHISPTYPPVQDWICAAT
jgi:hypothetical protein